MTNLEDAQQQAVENKKSASSKVIALIIGLGTSNPISE